MPNSAAQVAEQIAIAFWQTEEPTNAVLIPLIVTALTTTAQAAREAGRRAGYKQGYDDAKAEMSSPQPEPREGA